VKAGVIFILLLLDLLRWDAHWVKSLLPPAAAKFYIEAALDSLILLRKINESSAASNNYLARSAEK